MWETRNWREVKRCKPLSQKRRKFFWHLTIVELSLNSSFIESPRMRSSQETVLEDAQTLNSWDLYVSTEEIIAEIFLEIPDVASFAALLVCLSETLALLRISSISKTGVVGGPWGFAMVLGLLEDTLFQWSRYIDDYNQNNFQSLSIIKARIFIVSQGSQASVSSPRQRRQFVITPRHSSRFQLEDAW